MTTPHAYKGSKRKLVLSIDVGTTFSGMSYAVLEQGKVPTIETVKRYPGKGNAPQDYRVPSILNYKPDGTVHSCGAIAESEDTRMELEYDDLILAKWFKLHLRPDNLDNEEGKTVVQVFADFLRFLFSCASEDIIHSNPAFGGSRWDEVKDDIEFVLTHPNGWEGLQQSKMREAAVLAQLVPDTDPGRKRIHFVTEGEAGLHFCLQKGTISESMKPEERIMVVDTGGGTVDISSYVIKSTAPLSVEEISAPDCIIQGSTVVNMRAERLLKARLANSPIFNGAETIRTLMENFDKKAKPLFSGKSTRGVYINTGLTLADAALNIKKGNVLLTQDEMLSFFRPSLDAIVNSIRRQFQSTPGRAIASVFLIGGFSANEWLYDNLKESLGKMGLLLYRPEEHMSKAVSEGAISFYLDRYVSYRIAKATLGTQVHIRFNPLDPRHRLHLNSVEFGPAGPCFEDGFSTIVKKGTRIKDNEEFSEEFCVSYHKSRTLNDFSTSIIKYTGHDQNPRLQITDPDHFKRLCLVRGNLSEVATVPFKGALRTMSDEFRTKEYKIILRYGPET
ncbi:hypothetical protein C8Q74DRAFT_1373996 [Fomes fomentarius]|nr:hypothetical protein C8Q74DRAFT_1373996 [Fomes fomentarius]